MSRPLNMAKTITAFMKEHRQETKWGNWTYNPKLFTLDYYQRDQQWYEVDLDQCCDSAGILDWIFQRKAYYTAQDIDDLVSAFRDVLSPQSTVCSGGTNRRIKPREVAATNGYPVPPRKR